MAVPIVACLFMIKRVHKQFYLQAHMCCMPLNVTQHKQAGHTTLQLAIRQLQKPEPSWT